MPHAGSSNGVERTQQLQDDLGKAMLALGVRSFAIAFSDPDTPNWTWLTGENDLQCLGMARQMAADLELDLTRSKYQEPR